MKKLISLFISLILVISGATYVVANEYDNEFSFDDTPAIVAVPVYLNGIELQFDVPAQIIDDRTMVPLRAIFEELGAEVDWDDTTKTATSKKDDVVIKITIGENKFYNNGEEISLDVPAQIVGSRILVPLRAIAQSFHCYVEWLDNIRAVRLVSSFPEEYEMTPDDLTFSYSLDDEAISVADVRFYTNLVKNNMGVTLSEDQLIEVLKSLYATKFFVDEYRYDMTILDDDYVNAYINYMKAQGMYDSYISLYEATPDAIHSYIEVIYATSLLDSCYYDFSDEGLLEFARETHIRVKHILVETKEEAQTILSLLDNGASFEELAAVYSLDGMDIEDGYIFTYGQMIEPFEDASFALAEGEISAPVESQYGFHIIKKYPLSEIPDEVLLGKYYQKIYEEANSSYVQSLVQDIAKNITVTEG